MTALINLYLRLAHFIEYGIGALIMPALARFVFAALFAVYYWNSFLTKAGADYSGLFQPSFNAFAQIFPKGAEAISYDISQATAFQKAIVLAGTWAELVLPALIIVGLFTRLAAIGMVGFVVLQTLTDLYGHNVIADSKTFGAWFDGAPDSIIMDQRALWVMLLLVIVFRGAGRLSLDEIIKRKLRVA